MSEYLNNPQEISEENKESYEMAVNNVALEVKKHFFIWTGLELNPSEFVALRAIAREVLALDTHWEKNELHTGEVFSRFFAEYYNVDSNDLDLITKGKKEDIAFYINKLRNEKEIL